MFNVLLSVALLSCKDYDFLTRDLSDVDLSTKQKVELMIEFQRATDPKCFEQDAND